MSKLATKSQLITFYNNSETCKEIVRGKNMFPVRAKTQDQTASLVTSIKPIVDHIRKLGFSIQKGAVVSAYSQQDQGFEYLGRVG